MKIFSPPKMQEPEMNAQTPPTLQRMPARRPLSEVAAQAAQHVEDLQAAHDEAIARLQETINRNHLLEERCKMLEQDRKEAEHDRDYHKKCHILIEARLQSVASIMLDLLNVSHSATSDKQDERTQGLADAIEQDLKADPRPEAKVEPHAPQATT